MQDPVNHDLHAAYLAIGREAAGAINARLTCEGLDTMAASVAIARIWGRDADVVATLRGPVGEYAGWDSSQAAWERLLPLLDRRNAGLVAATGRGWDYWTAKVDAAVSRVFATHGLDKYGCAPRMAA